MHKRDHGDYTSKSGIAHLFLPKSEKLIFFKMAAVASWIYASTRPQNKLNLMNEFSVLITL